MKKKKFPKYIQDKFAKPQFKIGDKVLYEFLGDGGWGIITEIHKHNETISYMVKGSGYTYPCGLKIKEHRSYYAGTIFFEESDNYRKNIKNSGGKETKSRDNNKNGERVSNSNGRRVPIRSTGSSKKHDPGLSHTKNSKSNSRSGKGIDATELEDAISKQKGFLRKFT